MASQKVMVAAEPAPVSARGVREEAAQLQHRQLLSDNGCRTRAVPVLGAELRGFPWADSELGLVPH